MFRARDVRNPRSVTSPCFALTGQGVSHAKGLTATTLTIVDLRKGRAERGPFVRAVGAHSFGNAKAFPDRRIHQTQALGRRPTALRCSGHS